MPKKPRRANGQRWNTFLQNHASQIAALEFLTVPTVSFRILYVVVFLSHDRRRPIHFNVTDHPTSEWTTQQLRNAFYGQEVPKFLLVDNDSIFDEEFIDCDSGHPIRPIRTALRSPWQNGFAERLIGRIRRECLDPLARLKAVGYVWCSTEQQEDSPDQQKKEILAFEAKQGYEIGEWFEDCGKSGTTFEQRPAFERLTTTVENGRTFSAVICYDESRWGRAINAEENAYWRVHFRRHGVDVILVKTAVDPDHKFSLTGLIECSKCGFAFQGWSGKVRGKENLRYIDGRWQAKRVCEFFSIPRDDLERFAVQSILETITNPAVVERIEDHLRQMLEVEAGSPSTQESISDMVKEVDRKIQNLLDLMENGSVQSESKVLPNSDFAGAKYFPSRKRQERKIHRPSRQRIADPRHQQ